MLLLLMYNNNNNDEYNFVYFDKFYTNFDKFFLL